MNIEEPNSKDKKVIWHSVNNDEDFKPVQVRQLDSDAAINGGGP